MKFCQISVRALIVMVALFALAAPAWAAQCSDVYSSANGMNSNLQASGNTLDLSGVSWANNSWPSSGTTLSSGDYFFRTESLADNYQLNLANGARVRIFVNGSQTFSQNVEINSDGSANQLLLVTRGGLSIGNNPKINGLIYSAGALSVGNNAEITGGLAAAGSIGIGNTNPIADYSGVSSGLLNGLCELAGTGSGSVELSVNGDNVGPVEIGIDDNTVFSGSASDCPTPGAFSSQDWRETWRINGTQIERTNFSSSSCDRSPVDKVESFGSEGIYVVSWAIEFRSCFLGVFCGGWEEYGEDSIVVEVVDDEPLICFSDDFVGNELVFDDWVTSVKTGSFSPQVVNGRLRMTEAVSNQSTAATLQREIPGAENLVVLEFDYYAYGGNGADGMAVVLSDAAITPQPGSFGGSLGYAQRNNGDSGFAGGWLGIGIDEYGNFSAASEGRNGGRPGGRTRNSVAIRGSGSGTTGYQYVAGTGTLDPRIDETGQNNPHRYRITVDSRFSGQAVVSVERNTGNGFNELISPFNVLNEDGQAEVPENFLLSLTGSTGGSTNIHELDNLELCALKLNEVGDQIDHFEIIHDGVGLTCQAEEQITIRACATSTCSEGELFTDKVVANMAPSGWVGGDTITINGGEATASFRRTTPGTVELGVIGSNPATRPQSVTVCRSGNSGLSSANCGLRFYDTGLVFDVPDMVANEGQNGISVRAVRTEGSPELACVPAFRNVARDVDFWTAYINPDDSDVSATPAVTVNGDEVSGASGSPTSIQLGFDGNGEANIDVNYPEAGRMQLSASYQGSAANDDQGLTMPGADQFVSRPYGFCIEATSPKAACTAPLADCSVLTAAGDPFDLEIRAVASLKGENENLCVDNATTRNFRELLEMQHSLEAPSGGELGDLGETELDFTQTDEGEITVQQWVEEVGVFRFFIPAGQNYLSVALPRAESKDIGRFKPDEFKVDIADPGKLDPSCTGLNFIGQPLKWDSPPSLLITALNSRDTATKNYPIDEGFRKLKGSDITIDFPEIQQDIHDGETDLDVAFIQNGGKVIPALGPENEPGEMYYEFSADDRIWFEKNSNARVRGFLPKLSFGVQSFEDSDGVPSGDLPDPFSTGPDEDSDDAFNIYYGRLNMENVYGPQNAEKLLMPVHVEIWNGTSWNIIDSGSCMPADLAEITDWSETTQNYHELDNSGFDESSDAGNYYLKLTPSGNCPEGEDCTDTLEWPLASGADLEAGELPEEFDWLMDFWGRGSELDELQNPRATATFGVYRGNDRIIYWREVQN